MLGAWIFRSNTVMAKRKEYSFYAVVVFAVLVNEFATVYGVQVLTLLPLLLTVVYVGFWAFDVK